MHKKLINHSLTCVGISVHLLQLRPLVIGFKTELMAFPILHPFIDFGKWWRIGERIIIIPYPTAFPYGNGMVLHFYQQQESSTTKTTQSR